MAKFKYIALDKEGRELSGVIESTSENRARKELAAQGFSVSRIAEVAAIASDKKATAAKAKKPLFGTGVKKENITVFSRQLSTLLKAGLPLLRALEVIGRQEKNPYFKAVVEQLADNVRTGNKFSDGLSQHPKIFDKLYVNMAKAGEAGGVLDVVLDRLSTFQEKALKTTNKVKSAMVYPIVIMGVAVAIVAILMIFVVPQFQKIFTDMLKGNARMPALTQMIIDISDFMKENYILTGLIIVGVILFVKIFFKTKIGIRVWDTAALKLPKIGDLVMKSTVARHTARLRRSDTRSSDHHARYHQKQPDIRRPFEGTRPRKRRRKPLHAARPAKHIPDNGDKYGGSRRGNGPAPGDAQPHCRQLRRRS